MKSHGHDFPLSHCHRVPVHLREHLDPVTGLIYPGCPNEHRAQGVAEAGEVEIGLEALKLAPERVAARRHVEHAEMVAVEHDHPRAGGEDRGAARGKLAQWLGEALALDPERHRGRLAARHDQPVQTLEVLGRLHEAAIGAELREDPAVRLEIALEGEYSDYHPRCWIRPFSPRAAISTPAIGWPSPRLARATRSASSKCVVASTIAAAVRSGSSDLKMPDPTKLPSAPSCIISAASAGVAMPPAQNSTTGSLPVSATSRTRSSGAWRFLAAVASSVASSV